MQRTTLLHFVGFLLAFAVMLIAIALTFLNGLLSVRAMAIAYIVLSLAAVWALTVALTAAKRRRMNSTGQTTSLPNLAETKRLVLALRALIVFSVGALGYGALASAGAPLLSRIFGIGVGTCVTVGLVFALRKQGKRLAK